ncbi:hypothetical protein DIPPA_29047 [Diplonema papillatum]|nr:hypothetical protein DIPPA_29047 [Diplonema papillatum]
MNRKPPAHTTARATRPHAMSRENLRVRTGHWTPGCAVVGISKDTARGSDLTTSQQALAAAKLRGDYQKASLVTEDEHRRQQRQAKAIRRYETSLQTKIAADDSNRALSNPFRQELSRHGEAVICGLLRHDYLEPARCCKSSRVPKAKKLSSADASVPMRSNTAPRCPKRSDNLIAYQLL